MAQHAYLDQYHGPEDFHTEYFASVAAVVHMAFAALSLKRLAHIVGQTQYEAFFVFDGAAFRSHFMDKLVEPRQ